MPKSCSSDLRERVLAAVEEGATRREAAERFEVSPSSAVKWFQAWEREGRRTAKPRGGSRSPLEDHADEILALVNEHPGRWRNSSRPCTGAGFPAAAARCGGFSSATASASKMYGPPAVCKQFRVDGLKRSASMMAWTAPLSRAGG